jgi:signal transduction histidine kinase
MFKVSARTILELGSELISSDIIAFYELIKNSIDAGSKTGADIRFHITLSRNDYLKIRGLALQKLPQNSIESNENNFLSEARRELQRKLDGSADPNLIANFNSLIEENYNTQSFVEALDEAYRSLNFIEVEDTGSGMSLEQLKQNFLTIGTASRKREVDRAVETGADRTPYLGEKGIGRLSTMRLGQRLHLTTAREQDTHFSVLDIDWRSFSDLDAMVEDISIDSRHGSIKNTPGWHGTTLRISDLSEDWTKQRVERLAGYDFARLTDPFLDQRKRPRIALFWNGSRIAIPSMDSVLLSAAHASFSGRYEIDEKGNPTLYVRMEAIDLGGFKHPHEVDNVTLSLPDLEGLITAGKGSPPIFALASVGPFEFDAYWYNRRYLTGIDSIGNQKAVRELQRNWSSIMLFRDGFRVFPYGDEEDDWLGLDRRALGRTGYVLNKAQFVGRVQISRLGNPNLVDQTNREGLRSTPEQQVFVALLHHVIGDLLWDFFKETERQHKKVPIELGDVKTEVSKLESRAKSALAKVRRLVPREQANLIDEIQQAFDEFHELSIRAQTRIEEVEEDSRQMIHMAGVGLMVEVIAHELARASESSLQAIDGLRSKDMPLDLRAKLETLKAEMKSVSKRLRVLDELSVSGRQRAETFDLVQLVEDIRNGHEAQCNRHNINFVVQKESASIRIRAVKGMVVQILENLLSNSIHWTGIRAERESAYMPTITIGLSSDPPTIRFSDNGRGIAPENREKIFRPFWSLKEKSKRRGLGLFIARENATYLGGTLTLSDFPDKATERLHEFVLELPQAIQQR